MPSVPVSESFLKRSKSDLEDAWGLLEGLRNLLLHRPLFPISEYVSLEKERGAEYADLCKDAFVGNWYYENQELIEPLLNACRKICQHSAENIDDILERYEEQEQAAQKTPPPQASATAEPAKPAAKRGQRT